MSINIKEKMDGPVYVYYQLDNFYQNHRTYVKSVNYDQLGGDVLSVGDLDDCDPVKTNGDAEKTLSWTNQPLNSGDAANP